MCVTLQAKTLMAGSPSTDDVWCNQDTYTAQHTWLSGDPADICVSVLPPGHCDGHPDDETRSLTGVASSMSGGVAWSLDRTLKQTQAKAAAVMCSVAAYKNHKFQN